MSENLMFAGERKNMNVHCWRALLAFGLGERAARVAAVDAVKARAFCQTLKGSFSAVSKPMFATKY